VITAGADDAPSAGSATARASVVPEGSPFGYRPQLDGLRAFAVAGVVIHHFLANGWGTGAILGVKLFFVLSGFLITTILLRARGGVEVGGDRWHEAKRFYVRRFLRIFPLYYFVVLVCLVIDLEPAREIVGWLATYTLNFKIAWQGYYEASFAHFWTLAVEEQFYLAWPWVILFAPRRWLPAITAALVAVGPLYRWQATMGDGSGLATYVMTPAYADTLGMGALLAVLSHDAGWRRLVEKHLTATVLPFSAATFLTLYYLEARGWDGGAGLFFGDLALSGVFCWLIAGAARGFGGPAGQLLEARPFRYLGRISYGIYVYHPFVPALCLWMFARAGWSYQVHPVRDFVLFTAVTLLVSAVSWRVLEKPLNDLGHREATSTRAARRPHREFANT
jgi:peptidoglycan/LPS O-acetylase OafA/YrhL